LSGGRHAAVTERERERVMQITVAVVAAYAVHVSECSEADTAIVQSVPTNATPSATMRNMSATSFCRLDEWTVTLAVSRLLLLLLLLQQE